MLRPRSLLPLLVVVSLAGCEWFDSLFARDAGEPPPLPPPPVLPTPVGTPEPTPTPPTPPTPPSPPPVPPIPADGDGGLEAGVLASEDGGALDAGAVASIDSGAEASDGGLVAVQPTPVTSPPPTGTPSTPPTGTPRQPSSSGSTVPASCRRYERCCRSLGGGAGLGGLAGGCRDFARRAASPDADRLCRQALAGIRAAVAFLPNAPSACR